MTIAPEQKATNLALWNAVEKTDPSQTKAITGKPYKGTSPKPHYLIHKATETFGPCGLGWGFHVVNERVEDGATGDKVHIAHVRVWYIWDGARGEVDHVGQTMFAGKNRNGPFTDEDAPKKSVTDALVKALSMIGFAGDIFMGRYDDSKYVSDLKEEIAEQTRGAAADAPSEMLASTLAYIEQCERMIADAKDPGVLRNWWEGERANRETHDLPATHDENIRLKSLVVARITQLRSHKEAA